MSARVLITGAASGIGAGTAAELRRRGARVVGLDLVADEAATILACDVTDQSSVDTAVTAAIERLDGLDAVVNCAGIGDPQSAGERPGEDALRVLDVNLLGPWRVTAAAIEALRESGGRVVNIASGLAHLSIPFATAYCMSKRGLVAYSDALRLEYGDEIDVTTVYPGYIRTPIHDAAGLLGVSLEGAVPEEKLTDAVAAVVRATLGKPVRDLATTRQGAVGYALLKLAPRPLVDRIAHRRLRASARRGDMDGSELTAGLRRRLLRSG